MKKVLFYQTRSGKCPVEEFLDSLSDEQVSKVLWVLRIIRDLDYVPAEYFKKLRNTEDIWEVRIKSGKNIFRLLGFYEKEKFIVLTNGFAKKTQKTPKNEIESAQERKKDYLKRKQ